MLLGLAPMFGALVAGIIASNNSHPAFLRAQKQVEAVGTSFFIPIYFTLIGVSLDLIKDFDWQLTFGILIVGCIVKYGGALLGGILAKEKLPMANALAISVNARGGPGLVVASTAFTAGIINPAAYTSLVILAIVTSVFAGIFLARALQAKATRGAILSEPLDVYADTHRTACARPCRRPLEFPTEASRAGIDVRLLRLPDRLHVFTAGAKYCPPPCLALLRFKSRKLPRYVQSALAKVGSLTHPQARNASTACPRSRSRPMPLCVLHLRGKMIIREDKNGY